jgi:hypothetical protein
MPQWVATNQRVQLVTWAQNDIWYQGINMKSTLTEDTRYRRRKRLEELDIHIQPETRESMQLR